MVSLHLKRFLEIYRFSKKAYGGYKIQIVILTLLGFLGGLLEGIGISAVIPMLSFIAGGESENFITEYIRKIFSFLDIDFSLKYLLIFTCLLFLFKAVVLLISSYVGVKISADYEKRTKVELMKAMLGSDWKHSMKQKAGYLETILMVDVLRATLLLTLIGNSIISFTGLLIYVFIAINISFNITFATVGLAILSFLIFKPFISKTRNISREVAEINKLTSHFVNESVVGIKTIKSMNRNAQVLRVSSEFFKKFERIKIKIMMYRQVANSFMQPIGLIFICFIFAYSYKSADFSLPAFVAVVYLINRIFQHAQQMQRELYTANESLPFLKEVLSYKDEAEANQESKGGKEKFVFDNKLELSNIEFQYNDNDKIFSKLNLTIKKGEMVGVIGPSGGGKTTFVDILLRLLKPLNGKMLLDGKTSELIDTGSWRKNFGYVSQDIFLLNDTIENNIKFYNDNLTKEEIDRAAKMANIYDFIEKCPNKFDTVIGERGIMLSGGQRQRIIIARVLAFKPKILILDEATSALDNESELKIQKVIENLKGKMTVIVIAHRLSTVLNCDKIITIENGKIIESGKPKKLLQDKNSYFYKTYNIRK